jgi:hypothetical protein
VKKLQSAASLLDFWLGRGLRAAAIPAACCRCFASPCGLPSAGCLPSVGCPARATQAKPKRHATLWAALSNFFTGSKLADRRRRTGKRRNDALRHLILRRRALASLLMEVESASQFFRPAKRALVESMISAELSKLRLSFERRWDSLRNPRSFRNSGGRAAPEAVALSEDQRRLSMPPWGRTKVIGWRIASPR